MSKLLCLSSWWGLSNKPGKKHLCLNEDGTYTAGIEFSLPKDQTGNITKTGHVDQSRLTEIKEYIKSNITHDVSNLVLDAGNKIEYYQNEKIITLVNDSDTWRALFDLLPEYKAVSSLQ